MGKGEAQTLKSELSPPKTHFLFQGPTPWKGHARLWFKSLGIGKAKGVRTPLYMHEIISSRCLKTAFFFQKGASSAEKLRC